MPSTELQCLETMHQRRYQLEAAVEVEMPAEEAPQPDDGWADIANTPITASGRRVYITPAMVKKFGAVRRPSGTGSSSQHEPNESSKLRRIMGLETWTAEEEPGASARSSSKQYDQMLEICELLAARHWRISSQRGPCTARSWGQTLATGCVGRAQKEAGVA